MLARFTVGKIELASYVSISTRTLNVGNGDGVSSLDFLKAGSPFAFFLVMIELADSPTPSNAVYTDITTPRLLITRLGLASQCFRCLDQVNVCILVALRCIYVYLPLMQGLL